MREVLIAFLLFASLALGYVCYTLDARLTAVEQEVGGSVLLGAEHFLRGD